MLLVVSDRLLFNICICLRCLQFFYLNSLCYLLDDFTTLVNLGLLICISHLSVSVTSILLLGLIFIILKSELDELFLDFLF